MQGAVQIDRAQVREAARQALAYVCANADTDGRAGGYFGLFPRSDSGKVGSAIVFEPVGTINPDKVARYSGLAQEKPRRLSQHSGHKSSWQSRDEAQDRWGGAIVADDYYLSFSGLPELCDEALVLIAARILDLIDDQEATRIAGISGNSLYTRFARASAR